MAFFGGMLYPMPNGIIGAAMPKHTAPIDPAIEGLPERLRRSREDRGIGCNELDRLASVGIGTTSKLESGRGLAGISANVLLRIARALSLRPGWLIAGDGVASDDGRFIVLEATPQLLELIREGPRKLPAAATR